MNAENQYIETLLVCRSVLVKARNRIALEFPLTWEVGQLEYAIREVDKCLQASQCRREIKKASDAEHPGPN